jgi:murein DD-endopeptidase MepM/ murein hydrolase activator NlpD
MSRSLRLILPLTIALVAAPSGSASASGTWLWPATGAVLRGFDPPENPYGSGHRGIDIADPFGTPVIAPASGTVAFAGKVGGHLFVTLDHGGGLESTYSWLSEAMVHKGDVVTPGEVIALSGEGHPGSTLPSHLHFGVKLDGSYVDPLAYLSAGSVVDLIRLAPIAQGEWMTSSVAGEAGL